MSTTVTASADLAIVSVAGPTSEALALKPPGPLSVGRRTSHALPLPHDEHVSRDHAAFIYQPESAELGGHSPSSGPHNLIRVGGRWLIRDTGSRHGTWVNGVRLEPMRECPIRVGDLIVIAPWTFQVVDRGQAQSPSTLMLAQMDASPDSGATIKRIGAEAKRAPAQMRLDLLLDCAGAIHASPDEPALAEAVLDAALAGTGFANGAILRPIGSDESVEIVAHRGMIAAGTGHGGSGDGHTMAFGGAPRLSKSLIAEAALGVPAILVASGDAPSDAYSVVQLGIEEAICVPLMLGPAVSGFLYLDNRRAGGEGGAGAAPDAPDFALGLGRLAAMALANLKRAELERRQGALDAEMTAAAEAQRFILPPRTGSFGPFTYIGESRAGRGLGGDFFDVIPLDDQRLAVALGDVTGKGIAASVLMTATQGFLNAALQRTGDPAQAVEELNRFVHPRTPAGRFVTLWVGVFDAAKRTLTYVDAGHGYAMLRDTSGNVVRLDQGTGPPVGIDSSSHHAGVTTPLAPGSMALLVSDGFVEQPAPASVSPTRRMFGMEGVTASLQAALADPSAKDPLHHLFAAVEQHGGGSTQLADDATALLIRC